MQCESEIESAQRNWECDGRGDSGLVEVKVDKLWNAVQKWLLLSWAVDFNDTVLSCPGSHSRPTQ